MRLMILKTTIEFIGTFGVAREYSRNGFIVERQTKENYYNIINILLDVKNNIQRYTLNKNKLFLMKALRFLTITYPVMCNFKDSTHTCVCMCECITYTHTITRDRGSRTCKSNLYVSYSYTHRQLFKTKLK